MKISKQGIDLIKSFESCRLEAYPDPGTGGEPITLGWGHTGGIKLGDSCTQEEADTWLMRDIQNFEQCVSDVLEVEVTQEQFDSLVSFAFNVGCKALAASTLLKLTNAGNKDAAAQQFGRWNKSGGRVMAGLTRRRQAERDLFLSTV